MLNIVHDWCQKWCIELNSKKTHIVNFRSSPDIARTNYNFKCGNMNINVTDKYKYLGLYLNEFLDYNMTVKAIANSANRALGVIMAKHKAIGGFPFKTYTKLYNSLVAPILDYGAAVWGVKEFSHINTVHNRANRFFLGVGRYTPNAAVRGELGWKLPFHRQWSAVVKLWCRLCKMSNDRLPKKIFNWSLQISNNSRVKNWCKFVSKQ